MVSENYFYALRKIVTQRAIRFSIGLMALFVPAGFAQAGLVTATFLSTADNTQFDEPYVDNVSFGDEVKIVIAMDNGVNSLVNQTWSASDVLSITFDFNNGAHRTVFEAAFTGTTGNFVTDGSGTLTAVPTSWHNNSAGGSIISTNSGQSPNAWFLNQFNDKYYTDNYSFAVGIPNPSDTVNPSNWTLSSSAAPVAVPEPSSMVLFGLGALGMSYRARRKSKS